MPDEVHEIGGVFAVVDRESRIEPNLGRVFAQQARADRVKRTRPGEGVGHDAGLWAENLRRDPLDPPLHLGSRTAREGQQHDPAWIGTAHDEMPDAVSESVGLAGPRARDDEKRRDLIKVVATVLDRAALLRIEAGEVGRAHGTVPRARASFPSKAP